MSDELNFVQRARREKLDALEARGVAPFAYSVRPHARRGGGGRAAARGDAGGRAESCASPGRIVAWRGARQNDRSRISPT